MTTKTWIITGAASGFGREWTEAALERGDRVAAFVRNAQPLKELADRYGDALLSVSVDVTDRERVIAATARAHATFGRLDVVVSNAGFGHLGMVEELREAEVRASLETNLLGTLWVVQAALPFLRAQGSGHLVQVTSEGGITAFPQFGAYHAAKWAVEGLSQSLRQEVEGFGVRVTCLEPGPYATSFSAHGLRRSEPLAAYDPVRDAMDRSGWQLGDPRATRQAILAVVDSDDPPARVLLGRSLAGIEADYAERLHTWRAWDEVAQAAFGAGAGTSSI